MKRRVLISAIILLCLQAGLAGAADLTYKQGELIVRFADPGAEATIGPLSSRATKNMLSNLVIAGATVDKEYKRIAPGLALVKLPKGITVQDALLEFNRSGYVLYAEPNYKIKAFQTFPNDSRFDEQWALNNTGQTGGLRDADIDAPEAWDIHTGDLNIIVAVLDSGIDYNHPDLAANMWINPGEVNQPGVVEPNDVNNVDDDDNGYVDDIYGYDFVDNDSDPMDEHYHGTVAAGIIGAVGNNNEGIAGVCWTVRLMALRILDPNGEGSVNDAIAAIDYAIAMGADVINASWGTYDYLYSQPLLEAIQRAEAAGILFVAGAGNDGYYGAAYPAAYGRYYGLDNVISVMATDHNDNRAVWSSGSASNYGYSVDLGAPGKSILSTFPTNETAAMTARGYSTNYDVLEGDDVPVAQGRSISGTSAAAAHVSGAAALMWSANPDFTHTQIKQLILRSVDKTLPGLCASEGRLNLANAMNMVKPGRVLNTTTLVIYPTIQAAIDDANDGDELIADANSWYFETIDFNGLEITLRSGDVNAPPGYGVISPLTTYISGLFDAYNDIVTFQSGEDVNTVLKGFTIIDNTGYFGYGGIYCDGSSPIISNCNITGNIGDGIYCYYDSNPNISSCIITGNSGDGIYCYYDSDPNISNCTITGNSGSGIYCYYDSAPNISNCTITANTPWGGGGGIYCGYGSDPNITNCTITANTASGGGGGIYCTSGSDPNITNCAITGNSAGNGAGGGIYCVDSSPEISDCNISGNTAQWEGGGIYLENASPTITNCQITDGNSHWDGGGIYCGSGSDANITNSTISNNFAYYDCGGIYCADSSPLIKNCLIIDNTVDSWDAGGIFCSGGSPTITNCTFAGNSGNNYDGLGGAVYCTYSSRPVITNCIFSNNEDIAIYESDLNSDANVTYCLFYNNPDGDCYDFYIGAAYDFNSVVDPNGNFNQDPMFVRGRLGNYYLSQFEAGQILDSNGRVVDPSVNPEDATSPAVDAGSADANSLGMHLYSTRTDNYVDPNGNKDLGRVDIGYHYDDPLPVGQFYLYTYAINGSISPPSGSYSQYSQVPLEAAPSPGYRLKSWSGTDDDTSWELNNIVTMDSYKYVVVEFETIMVELRARVVGGMGTVEPRLGTYVRGRVVGLTTTPANPSHRVIWTGTDDDTLTVLTNTVTMVNDLHIVEVRFYAPRTLNVPGDYTNLQHAIDDAMDGDIVVIAPADEPYLTVDGFYIYGKAITITSANPDEPNVVARTVIEMQSPGPGGTVGPAFYFYYVGRDTVLNGLTIRGFNMYGGNGRGGNPDQGYWDGIPGGDIYGAAIRCWSDASPTIKNCIITDCSVRGGNGGNGAGGNDDHPSGGHGGWPGQAGGGGMGCLNDSNPLVINCTFDNCRAYGGNGGDGGNGNGDPWGYGGRGGGWYYSYDPNMSYYEMPYEWGPFDFYTWYSGHGGAVYCDQSSSATFMDCTFTNNRTEGGTCGICGITPPGYRAEPTIHWKIDNFGGAVYLGGRPYYYYYYPYDYNEPMNESKFMNCTFANNTADPTTTPDSEDQFVSYGGAVAFEVNSLPTFDNCTFNDNLASIGGAMYWEWAEPLVDDCNFVANAGLHGGGVYFVGGSSRIYRSSFRENDATGGVAEGGGIYCFDANTLILDCNITDNDANGSGGGIYFGGSEKLLVKNCLITGNSAGRDGGGISANGHAEPLISNCTIVGNIVTGNGFAAGYGGGLYFSYNDYANIVDSIIWDNSANPGDSNQIAVGTGFGFDPRPSTVAVSYSDVQGGTAEVFVDIGCTLEWDIDPCDPNYPTNIDADPCFIEGYHLSQIEAGDITYTDSPCVDAGSNTAVALGLHRYTTRTDSMPDRYIVDMGYHYRMPIRMVLCDLDSDGDVDLADLGKLSSYWLQDRCDFLGWCEGADLNLDTDVDFIDYAICARAYALFVDLAPPRPNPSEWETPPYEYYDSNDGMYYNRMVAVTASDPSGVEYDFWCRTVGYGSGWQDSPIYNVKILEGPNQRYVYKVRTRDKSIYQNMGDYSGEAAARQ